MLKVALFGAGNVATHLFNAFNKAEYIIVNQWYNRNIKTLNAYKNETQITDDLSQLEEADIFILAISDDAISNFSKLLPKKATLVVHTSGSVNVHDLDKSLNRGVFYPLQTFSKDVSLDFSKVPFCLETIQKTDYPLLVQLADAIGSPYYRINTEQRQTLHAAAVFVNNFTNQLYRIGHEITDAKNINFDILKPLIAQTAEKVQHISPYMAQTGPAMRNDKKTIKRHLKLLENPIHKDIYQMLTKAIQQTHGKKL